MQNNFSGLSGLGLFMGLRKGEISGLKFDDFDVENRTVRIARQVTADPIVSNGDSKITKYQLVEKAPKTENSYRALRVPKAIMDEQERIISFMNDSFVPEGGKE